MTHSAKSIYYFSFYILISAILLILIPKQLFGILVGEIAQEDVFIYHIVGLIALSVGVYYWHCGRTNQVEFFKITVIGRTLFFFGSILIIWIVSGPKLMMLMGVLDFFGAIWTYWALKKDDLL
jgi:hypothetical protein